MNYAGLSAIAPFLLLVSAGCSHAPGPSAVWLQRQGGIVNNTGDQRLARAAAKLEPCVGHCLSVRVLATQTPSAYSFPDGSIFVTEGLLHLLDDDELTAVIAHELGHLLGDKRGEPVVSLRGCAEDLDAESRADLLGTRLLRDANVQPGAMITMLRKIESSGSLPASCQRAMEHRAELLSAVAVEWSRPAPRMTSTRPHSQ
jgi:Zn-dependent protease with chaperone function